MKNTKARRSVGLPVREAERVAQGMVREAFRLLHVLDDAHVLGSDVQPEASGTDYAVLALVERLSAAYPASVSERQRRETTLRAEWAAQDAREQVEAEMAALRRVIEEGRARKARRLRLVTRHAPRLRLVTGRA